VEQLAALTKLLLDSEALDIPAAVTAEAGRKMF